MLLKPIMAGMVVLLLLIGAGLYVQYITNYQKLATSRHAYAVRLCADALEDYRNTMGAILRTLAFENATARLLTQGRKDEFTERYEGLFSALREQFGLAHMQFIDKEGRSVLRLASPERQDKSLDPSLLGKSLKNNGSVGAFDISGEGGLLFRMILPVYETVHGIAPKDSDLMGYIEVASDVDAIIEPVQALVDFSIGLVVDAASFSFTRAKGGGKRDPDTLPVLVDLGEGLMFYTPDKGITEDVAEALYKAEQALLLAGGERMHFPFTAGRAKFSASVLPLREFGGKRIGQVYVIESESRRLTQFLAAVSSLLFIGATVVFITRAIVSRKLDAADAEIKSMIDAIAEGEAMFENVFSRSDTGLVIVKKQSQAPIKANQAALKIFGVTQTRNIRLDRLLPLQDDDPLCVEWEEGGGGGKLMSISVPEGTRYCTYTRYGLGGGSGAECCSVRDITRLATQREQTRKQARFLQTIVDKMPSHICIKNEQLQVVLFNAAFADLFQYDDPAKLIGMINHPGWPEEAMRRSLESDRVALAEGEAYMHDLEFPVRGVTRIHSVAKKRISGPEGEIYVITVGTDVTEITEMRRLLEVMRYKAEAANIAKGQFLARVSHEIRTPMNAIIGMVHLALNAHPDVQQTKYLETIQSSAKNLLGIINDILDFSKIESGTMHLESSPFALRDVLEDVSAQIRALIQTTPVRFITQYPDMPHMLVGDGPRLRQVLLNLCNNAVKFTDEGHITLAVALDDDKAEDATLTFSVTDTGIGIPEAGRERLFDSFQQLDGGATRKYGGTGLGLAICRQFIELMGGRIDVESKEGHGSRFYFTITLQKSPETSPAPKPVESGVEGGRLRGAHVLVVEDNAVNMEIIVALLEQRGLKVTSAENGRQAVEAMNGQIFDLVFMDLQMPVMDGLTAAGFIRNSDNPVIAHVPIVALTANAMNTDRERCAQAGMNDFLAKPIDLGEFDACLNRWLGDARPDGVSHEEEIVASKANMNGVPVQ